MLQALRIQIGNIRKVPLTITFITGRQIHILQTGPVLRTKKLLPLFVQDVTVYFTGLTILSTAREWVAEAPGSDIPRISHCRRQVNTMRMTRRVITVPRPLLRGKIRQARPDRRRSSCVFHAIERTVPTSLICSDGIITL